MRVWPVVLAVACSGSGSPSETGSDPVPRPAVPDAAAPSEARSEPRSDAPPPQAPGPAACKRVDFPASIAVPEASGAVWVEASFGLPAHILVIGDSGNRGAFGLVDAATGADLGRGRLPLDRKASDDLEGLSRSGGLYYAITSGGYLRHFRRTGATRFELAVPSYPLAGASCASPRQTNCGRDFEGLCLADPLPGDGCAGFAASRRSGDLVCLRAGARGRLEPDTSQVIHVALPMTLSGCDIAPAADGARLYAATNLMGGNSLFRVAGWRIPTGAKVELLAGHATGFIEAVAAAPGGTIYRFSDSAAQTSAISVDSCPTAIPE